MKVVPKQVLEEIRAANDIVEVISAYLPLKRAGSSFKALCPFHKEKTPSFMVNPQRQIYHCFGCGAGGDVYRFIMEYDGVDFMAAVRMLAERAGIELHWEEDGGPTAEKDVLYRIHEEATLFFHRVLREHPEGAAARAYLARRDLGDEAVATFLLGFAPDRWDTMVQLARKRGFPLELMHACGLVLPRETPREGEAPFYDRFRGRLMFPIRDEVGRVIGFSGRVLEEQAGQPKYVNSPETALFRKSRVLFAFDHARKAIVDRREAIVVEGQIDAIRCHLAGFSNVVASQGTALTPDHAQLLKRYADTVVLVLDADTAGEEAALRAMGPLLRAGLAVRIATLPPGEDPDSMILRHGPEAFRRLVEAAPPALDFQIDVLTRREAGAGEAGLLRTARAVLESIREVPHAVQRDRLLRRAAERLGLSESALREDFANLARRPPSGGSREEASPRARPEHPAEEVALAELLVRHPEVSAWVKKYLPLDRLSDGACRVLIERLIAHAGEEGWDLVGDLLGADDELVRLAAQVQMAPAKITGREFSAEEAVKDLILVISRKAMERRRSALREQLRTAPAAERERLSVECQQLAVDMNLLRQGWEKARPILEI